MKTRFAGLLRGLLRRFEDDEVGAVPPSRSVAPVAPRQTARPAPKLASKLELEPSPAAPAPSNGTDGGEFEMPLQPVLGELPPDLRAKMTMPITDLGKASIFIPVSQVLPQLSAGLVKIQFGQLREAAPNLFRVNAEYDALPVVLPLNEVLARLNPQLLARSPARKVVSVSDDVIGPFAARAKPVAPVVAPAPPAATPLSAARSFRLAIPPAPPTPLSSRPIPFVVRPVGPAPAVTISRPPEPVAPVNNHNHHDHFPAAPRAMPTAPRITLPPTTPVPVPRSIMVPLSGLAEKWPEPIRSELTQLNLASAQIALPFAELETALKRGRMIFPWRTLRTWLAPEPLRTVSARDNLELNLPLKTVVPLFLAQYKPARKNQMPLPLADIPDLIPGIPQPPLTKPAPPPPPAPLPVTPAAPAPPATLPPTPAPVSSSLVVEKPVSAIEKPAPVVEPPRVAAPAPIPFIEKPISTFGNPNSILEPPVVAAVAQPATPPTPAPAPIPFIEKPISGIRSPNSILEPPAVSAPAPVTPAESVPPAASAAPAQPEPATPAPVPSSLVVEKPVSVIEKSASVVEQPKAAIPVSTAPADQVAPAPAQPAPVEPVAPVASASPVAAELPGPAASPPLRKPVDARIAETDFYVWGDTGETPRIDPTEFKRPPAQAATDFITRRATPREIVARAMALPGVVGTVVALPDGLPVASQVPPGVDADTLAAFLPRIFDRVSQSAAELQMGELDSLSFNVGKVPWMLFRANAFRESMIYFAAFGRAGASLPAAPLAALAAELDRHKQH